MASRKRFLLGIIDDGNEEVRLSGLFALSANFTSTAALCWAIDADTARSTSAYWLLEYLVDVDNVGCPKKSVISTKLEAKLSREVSQERARECSNVGIKPLRISAARRPCAIVCMRFGFLIMCGNSAGLS